MDHKLRVHREVTLTQTGTFQKLLHGLLIQQSLQAILSEALDDRIDLVRREDALISSILDTPSQLSTLIVANGHAQLLRARFDGVPASESRGDAEVAIDAEVGWR